MNSFVEKWRFINSGFVDGRTNMLIDKAMARVANTVACPTLRVYGWNPPAISLGFHQSMDEVDAEKCRDNGIDVVVRPTGGRAILHWEELTYAVVIPAASHFCRKEILAVYEIISRGILAALRELNIQVEFDRAKKTPKNFARGELSTLCYASSVQYEIGFQGRKLVGSAQRRIDGVVLQHGSILLGKKHLDLTDYLQRGDASWKESVKKYMERHTITINELCSEAVDFAMLVSAMKSGFSKELGIEFIDSDLSQQELDFIAKSKAAIEADELDGEARR